MSPLSDATLLPQVLDELLSSPLRENILAPGTTNQFIAAEIPARDASASDTIPASTGPLASADGTISLGGNTHPFADENGLDAGGSLTANTLSTAAESAETEFSAATPQQSRERVGPARFRRPRDLVQIRATDAYAYEGGDNPGEFTIRRTRPGGRLTVGYEVSGTATEGTDYQNLSGFVTFRPGQTRATVTINPHDDLIPDSGETVVLTLTSVSGRRFQIDPRHNSDTVTIHNTESGGGVWISGYGDAYEAGGDGVFAIGRDGFEGDLTISYSVSGTAVNGEDYVWLDGQVLIPDQENYASIDVFPIDDSIPEPDEDLVITLTGLSDPNYTIDPFSGSDSIWIYDDGTGGGGGGLVSISALVPWAYEDGGDGVLRVSREDDVGPLTVYYTVSGTAVAGDDYAPLSSSVTLANTESFADIFIIPVDDGFPDDGEDVVVTLTGVSDPNYMIDTGFGTDAVWIYDSSTGGGGLVWIEASDGEAYEDTGDTAEFTIYRETNAGDLTVSFDSSLSSAVEGLDFVDLPDSVIIPDGAFSTSVVITPIDDGIPDDGEDVIITLTGVSNPNYMIDTGFGADTVWIYDGTSDSDIVLSVTETFEFTPLSNTLVIDTITTEEIYISPGNTAELTIQQDPSGSNPDPSDILFSVDGGASPPSGNFASDPQLSAFGQSTINVGLDVNFDGFLQATEYQVAFILIAVDLTGAEVHAQRIGSGIWSEDSYVIKDGEHFDTGSNFKFKLVGGDLGERSMIAWQAWDLDGPDNLIVNGGGIEFSHRFFAHQAGGVVLGDARVRFYLDKNGDGERNFGEDYVDSADFWIQNKKEYGIHVDVSSKIAGITNQKIRDVFDEAEAILLRKDSADDWRSAVRLRPANITNFNATAPGEARPDPVLNQVEERDKHFNADADIVFVNELFGAGGLTKGHDWHQIIIDWSPDAAWVARAVAHEMGHGVGLDHEGHESPLLMHEGYLEPNDIILTKDDAEAYDD